MFWVYAALAVSLVSFFVAAYFYNWVKKLPTANPKLDEVGALIREGAFTFLRREYRVLGLFSIIVMAVIFLFFPQPVWAGAGVGKNLLMVFAYLCGTVLSALAGYVGISIATIANLKAATAARESIQKSFMAGFRGGAVMGMAVIGTSLAGAALIYIISRDADVIMAFSFGASSLALFAKAGGGIFTKTADIAADLTGKVELGIPEDDPRNPAVIADNVGDNVGDVAGMGADLFESYVGAIVSAITLGVSAVGLFTGAGVIFPLAVAAVGIFASIIATFFVRGSDDSNPHKALKMGSYVSAVIVAVGAVILSYVFFGSFYCAAAIIAGLIVGLVIGFVTEVYTSEDYTSVKRIASQSETGSATTIISGIAVGMMSTWVPIVLICVGIYISYSVTGDLYGIALAAVGMLSTTGITVAVDAYGPIADNSGGIAQMSGLDPRVREITDKLDAVGNTTAAMGKGFAIGSAALTALALFVSYASEVQLSAIDLLQPDVVIGLLIGGMLPFTFSALTMDSVSKAAYKMIEEVRRQFREIPGIFDGTGKPDYGTCVAISTKAALREMIIPGLLAVVCPLLVGILLGPAALGGLLAGSLVSGVLLAIYMSNAGGAWDNAKKYIESGSNGGKGSDAHKAAVVGDTVGDPFKDTAGPSINILIKLMTVVSVVFAPVFIKIGGLL